MCRSSVEFCSFSARWSLITSANNDGVSTGIAFLPIGDVPTACSSGCSVTPIRRGFPLECDSRLLKAPDGRVKLDPVLPLALGPVKGPVGRGEEVSIVRPGGVLGHPEARCDRHDGALETAERPLGE